MTVQGQDWSGYQPATPSTAGLGFAIVKATEGTSYVSPLQAQQAAHARAAGLVVGFYHFLWPGNIQAQAQYFVQQCASEPGDLLACDWETTESGTAASGAEKDEFLAAVKQLRPTHKVLLYCNRDFWFHHDTTSDCGDGLWIADPSDPAGHPGIQHPWVIHQYGENNGLDLDVADFTDLAAMRAWATGVQNSPTKPWVWLSGPWTENPATNSTLIVQKALHRENGLDYSSGPGHFGPLTRQHYAEWQQSLGYSGTAADGIPGRASLVALGNKYGFRVRAADGSYLN